MRISTVNTSLTFNPTSVTSTGNLTNPNNGLNSTSNTSYAQLKGGTRNTYYAYYWFDCSNIPNTASIVSVSCSIKAYKSSTSANMYAQLRANETLKGSSTSITSTGSATILNLTCGDWTYDELIAINLQLTAASNANLYFYGANLTITYEYNEVYYTVTCVSNSQTVTSSISSQEILANSNIDINFYNVSNIYELSVTDNNYNISAFLEYVSGTTYKYSISNISNDHSFIINDVESFSIIVNNTSNATVIPANGTYQISQYANYPIKIYSDDIYDIKVYDNDVDKSNSFITVFETTTATETILPLEYDSSNSYLSSGSITNQNNALTDSSSTTYARFNLVKGTTATSTYVFYNFNSIVDVPQNATINSVTCNVKIKASSTVSASSSNITSATAQLYVNDTIKSQAVDLNSNGTVVVCTAFDNIDYTELNNLSIKIKASCGGNMQTGYLDIYGFDLNINYTYETDIVDYHTVYIENINENHTIKIINSPKWQLTASSNITGVTISPTSEEVYEGSNKKFIISGVSNIYAIKLLDNNIDVSDEIISISGNQYSYTINNILSSHTLSIVSNDSYSITTTSNVSGVTINTSKSTVYKRDSVTITVITSDITLISISDNDIMITSNFTGSGNTYTYTINNVNGSHTIIINNAIIYDITLTNNSSYSTTPVSGVTTKAAGYDYSVIINIDDNSLIDIYDNNIKQTPDFEYISILNTAQSYSIYSGNILNGQTFINLPINNTSENPGASTSNNNINTESGTIAKINYVFDFSSIPSNAVIDSVNVSFVGHTQNTSYYENMIMSEVQLLSNNTSMSDIIHINSLENTMFSFINQSNWTRALLQNAILQFTVANYGGLISGISWNVTYHIPELVYKITNISDDHIIIISDVINGKLFIKNGNYIQILKAFIKVSGTWRTVDDPITLFESNKIYIKRD